MVDKAEEIEKIIKQIKETELNVSKNRIKKMNLINHYIYHPDYGYMFIYNIIPSNEQDCMVVEAFRFNYHVTSKNFDSEVTIKSHEYFEKESIKLWSFDLVGRKIKILTEEEFIEHITNKSLVYSKNCEKNIPTIINHYKQ